MCVRLPPPSRPVGCESSGGLDHVVQQEKLGDRHNRRAWLKGFLVRDLRRAGIVLGPGQCYGHKIPHHLGGVPGIENIEPVDLMVHVSVLGQLHRQTRALAPGTSIDEIRVVQPSSGPKDEVPSQ